MAPVETPTPPPVLWAQRTHVVFLTFGLEDCKDPTIRIEPMSIYFRGIGGTEKKIHEITINLYDEVEPSLSKTFVMDRTIELILKKKAEGPYWPRLTKDKEKYHWLKINFAKWRDEDDSESEYEETMEDLMKSMSDIGGGGGDRSGFDDIGGNTESEEEEEEDLPDLEDEAGLTNDEGVPKPAA